MPLHAGHQCSVHGSEALSRQAGDHKERDVAAPRENVQAEKKSTEAAAAEAERGAGEGAAAREGV